MVNRRAFLLGGAAAATLGSRLCLGASQNDDSNNKDDNPILFMRDVRYRPGSDAWKLNFAMSNRPRAATPAVIMIHGGGWVEGDKSSFDHYCTQFAKLGFFCATINYRLAREAPYPAAIEDCKCAIRWLRTHADEYNVDGSRIAVYGNSAGGHLALMAAMAGKDAGFDTGPYLDRTSDVQLAISDSGPTNLDDNVNHVLRRDLQAFLAGPAETLAERVKKGSPINYVDGRIPPLLLLYGTADTNVHVGPVDDFVSATSRNGNMDVTYIRLANVGHCPYSSQKVPHLEPLVVDFLNRLM